MIPQKGIAMQANVQLGIMGCGVVGKALCEYYADTHKVYTYDIQFPEADVAIQKLNANAEVVFICVPTLHIDDGLRRWYGGSDSGKGLDCSAVYDAVSKLTGQKRVIIKSTVMPGTTEDLQSKYPQHQFCYVPEFLSADTAAEDYAHPRRPHVVGITETDWFTGITELLPDIESVGLIHIPARQAELLKLATNAFYALKVTFANQMYDMGMTQETLDALGTDPWIGGEHFEIMHKGYRGYGGACLPKDTAALAYYAWQFPVYEVSGKEADCESMNLFQVVENANKERLSAVAT